MNAVGQRGLRLNVDKSSRVESSLYAKRRAGPIGHRYEKQEMKCEQKAKYEKNSWDQELVSCCRYQNFRNWVDAAEDQE